MSLAHVQPSRASHPWKRCRRVLGCVRIQAPVMKTNSDIILMPAFSLLKILNFDGHRRADSSTLESTRSWLVEKNTSNCLRPLWFHLVGVWRNGVLCLCHRSICYDLNHEQSYRTHTSKRRNYHEQPNVIWFPLLISWGIPVREPFFGTYSLI